MIELIFLNRCLRIISQQELKAKAASTARRSTCFCCPRVASRVIFVGQSSTETPEHSGGGKVNGSLHSAAHVCTRVTQHTFLPPASPRSPQRCSGAAGTRRPKGDVDEKC